jgi:hypothetical protein
MSTQSNTESDPSAQAVSKGKKEHNVRKARRIHKMQRAAEMYPEDSDYYLSLAGKLETELRAAKCCYKCGRVLKDPERQALGIGIECEKREEKREASS